MSRTVLTVDDSRTMRDMLHMALTDAGFRVLQAVDGVHGLEMLEADDAPDVIITDINMPDVNGLELIHFIRRSEQYRTTPLVIISTQATERDVERGKKLGADAYVPKPFSPDLMRETCARLLGTAPPAVSDG